MICAESQLTHVIDEFLQSISSQTLVDSQRVVDFCLDLRGFASSAVEDSTAESAGDLTKTEMATSLPAPT